MGIVMLIKLHIVSSSISELRPLLLTFHEVGPVLGGGVIAHRFPGEVSRCEAVMPPVTSSTGLLLATL